MSKLELDIDIKTGGGSKQTLKELKKEIKDLTSEVLSAEEGTKEWLNSLNRLAQAKDKLQDLNKAVNALDPGAKAAAFARLGSTLANGFQAATGAMALMGVESEELTKTLLKVQAATALAQGVQGMKDFGKEIVNVGNVIKVAFSSNPIGAIIIALTAVTAAIAAVVNQVTMYSDEVDVLNEKLEEQKKIEEDRVRIINNEITALTGIEGKEREILVLRKEQIEESIKTAQASVAVSIQKLKEAAANDTLFESLTKLIGGEKAYHLLKATRIAENIKQLQEDKKLLDELGAKLTQSQTNINNFDKQEKEKQIQQQNKHKSELEKLNQEKNDIIIQQEEYYAKLYKQIQEEKTKKEKEELDKRKKQVEESDKERYEVELKGIEERNRLAEDMDKKREDEEKRRGDARKGLIMDVVSSIASIGNIFINNQKKLEKFNKGIAVTNLAIDSAMAISKAVAASAGVPFPGNLPAIATAVAAVLANIAKARQLLSTAGETSAPSLSGASSGTPAASFTNGSMSNGPALPQNTSTQLNNEGQIVQAVVVETELSTAQRRIRNYEDGATI